MSFFSWFKHESIGPDVRVLNAAIFVHSTPNSIIGKGYFAWRSQMSSFSWFKYEFISPDVRALNATNFAHSTPYSILVGDIVHEDHKWVFLADLSTSP